MGEMNVKHAGSQKQVQTFVKYLLHDIQALEKMLREGWFDKQPGKIGAEQELCIIDRNFRPAPLSMQILELAKDPSFTTELAKFNLEINLLPLEFSGTCLRDMEQQIRDSLHRMQKFAHQLNTELIITGILPTIRKSDLEMTNLTPMERYYALCKAINKLRGGVYELNIRGIDELSVKHDSPLLEAANTGFQVHMQVNAGEMVQMYNIAQAIAGPVMAASVSSPILFGKRLWHETRTALFQQSIDTRSASEHLREMSPRVTFGNHWIRESVMEIYREDIVRYRVLLSSDITENVFKKIESGEAPELSALKVHNSSVYRWNRPCYGISNGKAHLRIENRILPSGPSVVDEIANAAFWLGLMNGYKHRIEDVTRFMEFEDARTNFISAAQLGLDTNLKWFHGKRLNASRLILDELLPVAEEGLKKAQVEGDDISKYLGIIEKRVSTGMTGSQWMLDAWNKLSKETTRDDILSTITASIVRNQQKNTPVHEWEMPELHEHYHLDPSSLLVEEFMDTDLFTVQPTDILALVAEMMDWQKIRYVVVEDKNGNLAGLVSSRLLLRTYGQVVNSSSPLPPDVKSVMIPNPISITPDATIREAMDLMTKHKVGCLPVVKGKRLVGVLTEQTFLTITRRLLNRVSGTHRDQ